MRCFTNRCSHRTRSGPSYSAAPEWHDRAARQPAKESAGRETHRPLANCATPIGAPTLLVLLKSGLLGQHERAYLTDAHSMLIVTRRRITRANGLPFTQPFLRWNMLPE